MQKALRSLETGRFGFGADGKKLKVEGKDHLLSKLAVPNAERIFYLREAFKEGMSVQEMYDITGIDPWFLNQLETICKHEETIQSTKDDIDFRTAKKYGFSDRQIAHLTDQTEIQVRESRKGKGIQPTYRLVDTCAAEFEAFTPYYYSTYGDENETRDGDTNKIMILGGGPNRIGQGIEFDYCCVHAAFALKELGYETIMVNSNPETVSTDYDTSDKLYFEPLTFEDVLNIYEAETPSGTIVQFGGQTPLNLAAGLESNGVKSLELHLRV